MTDEDNGMFYIEEWKMAKKQKVIEDGELANVRWINTPYAFAQLGRNMTLLQMRVLLTISDHLQEYVDLFFKKVQNRSKENPLCLFDERTLQNLPTLKIPYRHFGVPVNHRSVLYNAINEVLRTVVKTSAFDDGKSSFLFSQVEPSSRVSSRREYRNGYVELRINRDVAPFAFNMKLGYINHPSSLVENSSQLYAPRLYFLIKHRLRNGRIEIEIRYEDLRDELGLSICKMGPSSDSDVTVAHYFKFSEFKTKVLDPAVNDINRMADSNMLDITVNYEINNREGITRGNPERITFKTALSKLGKYHRNPTKNVVVNVDCEPLPKESKIDYKKERESEEWKKKSFNIKRRDDFSCQVCGVESWKKPLHVHHITYVDNLHYWDYPDELLITLCEDCHKREHDLIKVFKTIRYRLDPSIVSGIESKMRQGILLSSQEERTLLREEIKRLHESVSDL